MKALEQTQAIKAFYSQGAGKQSGFGHHDLTWKRCLSVCLQPLNTSLLQCLPSNTAKNSRFDMETREIYQWRGLV